MEKTFEVFVYLRKNVNIESVDPRLLSVKGYILPKYQPYTIKVRAYNKQVACYIAWDCFKFKTCTYMARSMFKITAKSYCEGVQLWG